MAAAPSRVAVEERLFSLVLALLATESGLTKTEILSTVQGYRQRYEAEGVTPALERQFERDKDDIRELGVPLETVDDPGDPGNNQALRYRIPKGEYDLPEDVEFSPNELALLNLAANVWREGSLSGDSRRALMKLHALGSAADELVVGYAPQIRARDAAFEPLNTALGKNQLVRFPYLNPGRSEAMERIVAPLALVQFGGRWLLYAREQGAGIDKSFLLSRIVGPVRTTGKTFPRPAGDSTAAALKSLQDFWEQQTAEVRVQPGTDAATRLAKRRGAVAGGNGMLALHYSDLNLFADELASFGPEVLVLSPPELRDAVRTRLERTAADHG
ncbi:helix-turn-helix transcriptional regulator [Lysobacter korlensis]|uniref:Helix-turn-helix transcriptional regulator n=1 Tax=Lysobacter korlensis TaxID=553636 RepID=A0ABV6RWU3_9GAMM